MLKSLLFLVVCFVVAVRSAQLVHRYELQHADQLFEEFVRTHHRQYQNEEERQIRFKIFKGNLKRINKLNMKSKTSTFGINRFTDMTIDEAIQSCTCLKAPTDDTENCPPASIVVQGDNLPESFDWRDQNKVTKVKDQLRCGSCWAFSAVGNLEGQYAIKHNELKDFSEQQLVDCDRRDDGCDGGYISSAFKWLKDHGGIEAEEDYPYIAKDQKCRFVKNKVKATVSGCQTIDGSDEHTLKQYLVSTGPLSLAVNAIDLVAYQSGILDSCMGGQINHAVLLVGYGTENNIPYWIIKNSWGESYGEKGYVRVKMYINACNLTADIMSAVVN